MNICIHENIRSKWKIAWKSRDILTELPLSQLLITLGPKFDFKVMLAHGTLTLW